MSHSSLTLPIEEKDGDENEQCTMMEMESKFKSIMIGINIERVKVLGQANDHLFPHPESL